MLHAQRHDRVDYIVVVLFQRLDSLLSRRRGLLHDELNVPAFQAVLVNHFIVVVVVVIVVILLGVTSVDGLALAVAVAGVAVVVAGVCVCLGLDDLLGGGSLGLGVEVLDLGLAKDAVGCQLRLCGKVECAWVAYIQVLLAGDL